MRTEKRNARKGSVLVVDDEEIMREVLETLLSAEGYRVDLAKTGEEGLEAYGRRAFDVVLLDLMLPGMDGWQVMRKMRAQSLADLVRMAEVLGVRETAASRYPSSG